MKKTIVYHILSEHHNCLKLNQDYTVVSWSNIWVSQYKKKGSASTIMEKARTTTGSESEFNEFEPRLKSTKNWFQFSAGLNLEILNTILVKSTIFEPQPKFFKFNLSCSIKLVQNLKYTLFLSQGKKEGLFRKKQ